MLTQLARLRGNEVVSSSAEVMEENEIERVYKMRTEAGLQTSE
jgi:hypothetical protein